MKTKNILIFGAGAVGRVLGSHFKLLGSRVTFLVRSAHIEALAQQGIRLYNVQHNTELRMSTPELVTEIPEGESYDLIFLCVRSDQVDSALPELQKYFIERQGILVAAQPGRRDVEKLAGSLPQIPLVPIEPGFWAYLTDERLEYWFPKWRRVLPTLVGAPINETLHVRDQLVSLLNECGIPAKAVNDIEAEVRFPFSAGMPLLVAFELSGFSFSKLRENKILLKLTAQGIREAVSVVKKELDFIPLKYRFLEYVTPALLEIALFLIDHRPQSEAIKKMWESHTRKIHAQTYEMLDDLLDLSQKHNHNGQGVALNTLAAMTPAKLQSHLRTLEVTSSKRYSAVAAGIAMGVGAWLTWKACFGKKRK